MNIDLSGKIAIVTGSTNGIGRAIATGLAGSGATVVITGRTQEAIDTTIAGIAAAHPGANVRGVVADLGTAEGCDALVQAEPVADILVNNLGIYGFTDFFEIPDSEWTRFYEVNVLSGVRLSRAYTQAMADRGWGRVIFISSESGLNIPPDMIHYGFTKTANLSVARGLAKRMAGTGVTVNAVLPGPTMTENLGNIFKARAAEAGITPEEMAARFIQEKRPSSIIGRPATVEEVANMVVYVASPQASATTGAALRVDGGVVDSL